jgi:hypothetical protein
MAKDYHCDAGRPCRPDNPGRARHDTASRFPTVAEIEAEIETRANRKGVGSLFLARTAVNDLYASSRT